MHRRRFLQSLAIGTASTAAGCSGIAIPTRQPASVTGTETGYPLLAPVYYHVDAKHVDEPEDEPMPFEDLEPSGRFDLANAIHGVEYWNTDSHLLDAGFNDTVFSYRGQQFRSSIGVGDRFSADAGPKYDPEWIPPVELDAVVEDDKLTITLTNELSTGLAVHHFGRPYFGVLVAVNGTTAVLEHGSYETNEHIDTSGIITIPDWIRSEAKVTESLSPGEALQESYGVPDDLPAGSKIWFSIDIGDESIEQFGKAQTMMTGTISVETRTGQSSYSPIDM